MKASCKISIDFDDKEKLESILKSIKVDDYDFVKSKIEDDKIVASIKSNSISSLLHTLDDYLACISVAEKVLKNK